VSFANSDITTLLPCDEQEFQNGVLPERRAALDGTLPALQTPALTTLRTRSLFASLVQGHYFWGQVARLAVSPDRMTNTEAYNANHEKLVAQLNQFESSLPPEHRFSEALLKHYRREHKDLVRLSPLSLACPTPELTISLGRLISDVSDQCSWHRAPFEPHFDYTRGLVAIATLQALRSRYTDESTMV
jgi:hypothetical protein